MNPKSKIDIELKLTINMSVNSDTGHSPIPESDQTSKDSEVESTLPELTVENDRNRYEVMNETYERNSNEEKNERNSDEETNSIEITTFSKSKGSKHCTISKELDRNANGKEYDFDDEDNGCKSPVFPVKCIKHHANFPLSLARQNSGHSPIPESDQTSKDSEAKSTLSQLTVENERNRHEDPPEFYEAFRKIWVKLHKMVYHGEYDEPTARLVLGVVPYFNLSRPGMCKINHENDPDYANIVENDNNNEVMNETNERNSNEETNERNSDEETNNIEITTFSKSKGSKHCTISKELDRNANGKEYDFDDEDNGCKSPVFPVKCIKHHANFPLSLARQNSGHSPIPESDQTSKDSEVESTLPELERNRHKVMNETNERNSNEETNERNSDEETNSIEITTFSKSKGSKHCTISKELDRNANGKEYDFDDEDNGCKSPVFPVKCIKHHANFPLSLARQNSGSNGATTIAEQDKSQENVIYTSTPKNNYRKRTSNGDSIERKENSRSVFVAVQTSFENLRDHHEFDNNFTNTSSPKNYSLNTTSNGDDDPPQINKRSKFEEVDDECWSFKTVFEGKSCTQYVILNPTYENCNFIFGNNY